MSGLSSNTVSDFRTDARPMRVMWFTARALPAVAQQRGLKVRGSGYWIASLLDTIKSRPGLKLAVVTTRSGGDVHFSEGGVDYFVVNVPHRLGSRHWKRTLQRCAELAERWQPDLIHVHGSETLFGLLEPAGLAPCPLVVSMQGLLSAYRENYFGVLSRREVLSTCRMVDLLTGRGLFWDWWRMGAMVRREKAILGSIWHAIGRTAWDRARLWNHNPDAAYYHVGEILRPPFFQRQWWLDQADRNCLFLTNARAPNNGMELLLEAMLTLRRRYPNLRLRVAGQAGAGYAAFLRRRIGKLGLRNRVEFLGYLDAETLSSQLARAHVFVLPSCIENSPNSLGEAQALGMPCVAGRVGGVPSMVDHGRTGLLVPPRDVTALAGGISALLDDDPLAARLGEAARREAAARHAPARVAADLIQAYHHILGRTQIAAPASPSAPAPSPPVLVFKGVA